MLQDLHKQGNTVVLITHDNSIAVQAERIIRLEDGRVSTTRRPRTRGSRSAELHDAEPKTGEEGTQA